MQVTFAAEDAAEYPAKLPSELYLESPALVYLAQNESKEGEESVLDKVKESGNTAVEASKDAMNRVFGTRSSADNRRDSDFSLFFTPINFGIVMPAKTGFAGTWLISEKWSLEADYLSGGYNLSFLGIDLFDLSERIISLNTRYYPGNSFNMKLGLGQRTYNYALGNDYLNNVTNGVISERQFLDVSNEVLLLGLGNRWQLDNGFTFGLDWLELIIPVGEASVEENILQNVSDQDDRDDIRHVIDYMRTGVTFNSVKINLGYSF